MSLKKRDKRDKRGEAVAVPERGDVTLDADGRQVELTNLHKIYFPERKTCSIPHAAAGIVAFPLVQDLPSLLWLINLGCIDINQWYGTCDDPDRPDYIHFDLDPVEGTPFERVREVALVVRDGLVALGMKPLAKTSGSSGMHLYVPIVRGPLQKRVWTVAKQIAVQLATLGQDARFGLFGAAQSRCGGLDAGDVGRSGGRIRDRRFPDRYGARSRGRARRPVETAARGARPVRSREAGGMTPRPNEPALPPVLRSWVAIVASREPLQELDR